MNQIQILNKHNPHCHSDPHWGSQGAIRKKYFSYNKSQQGEK